MEKNVKEISRDTRIKMGLHNHGNMLLRFLGIDDEVIRVEDMDLDALEGKNLKENFRAKLKSGRTMEVTSGIIRIE